jgi:hypothetical protein
MPPPAPGGDATIDIDPRALEKLKQALTSAARVLETDRFADVELADDAFGASPSAQTLGAEHRTAHRIIADTIQGVVTDLWGYRDGVEQFEAGMGTADDTAAEDLRAREVAVDALVTSSGSNHGESRYRHSQVDHLPSDAATDGAGGVREGDG